MKKLLLVVGLMGLVGCASKPAPYLDAEGYTRFAAVTVAFNRCTEAGLMNPEVTAFGRRFLQAELGGFNHYPAQLSAEIARISQLEPTAPAPMCNQIAAAVMEQKHRVDIRNAGAQQNQQALQNTLNNLNNSRPVYCNTVAGVTMCN